MNNREVFITVKPSSHADMIQHFLEQAGFKCTGSGQFGPDARDLWLAMPEGVRPEEFGRYFEPPPQLPT